MTALHHGQVQDATLPAEPNADGIRTNIIWMFGEQRRVFAVICNRDPNVRTLNVGILPRTGVDFDDAVSSYPLSARFRSSLLTSCSRHHCVPVNAYPLPPGQPAITQPFHETGCQTAHFGKRHLAGLKGGTGHRAMHIVPPDRRSGFANGSATKTTTANGTAGSTAAPGKTLFTTGCRDVEPGRD